MKKWKEVPIPWKIMDNCERDPRNLPVPFVVLKQNGQFFFKINDSMKSLQCAVKQLCTICGTHMDKDDRWLVGGIASAFDPRGFYIDLPVHKECACYALQVCPYLAVRNYNANMNFDKLQEAVGKDVKLFNPTVDDDRLPLFVLIRPAYIIPHVNHTTLDIKVKAMLPYKEVEYWCDGQQIIDNEIVKSKIMGTKWEKYLKTMFDEREVST